MNYSLIRNFDIANGPGVRISLFVSGCTHRCPGCFQPETWDFNYGKKFTDETIWKILRLLEPSYIDGLSILGGEPLDQRNMNDVWSLLDAVRRLGPPEKNSLALYGFDFRGPANKAAAIWTADKRNSQQG